jgi:small subunit ribosomal protein S3Ae
VRWLLTDAPAEAITKACQFVFPLNNIVVRKVKMLKKAKLDIQKLEDLYKDNIVTEKKNKNKKTKDAKEEEEQSKNLVDA